jgi:hypothetical protein
MINLDSRLLNDLDANELYLLCRITNRIGSNKESWPSNSTLCGECGWHIEKLLGVKKSLETKGIIKVVRKIGRSNRYSLNTNLIGNYVNGKSALVGNTDVTTTENPESTSTEIPIPTTMENPEVPLRKIHQVSINQEELDNEELTSKVLNREKQAVSFRKATIFQELIKTFWTDFNDFVHFYEYEFIIKEGTTEFKNLDTTTRNFLIKVVAAAEKIYGAFNSLKRNRLEFQGKKIFRGDREPDVYKESRLQMNAYFDFCRLSKTHMTTDPEKMPEKLIQCDWCVKLLDFIQPQIDAEKYDPAMDDEELLSEWLIGMYYTGVYQGYVCDRYNNRIVYAGEEYLTHRKK